MWYTKYLKMYMKRENRFENCNTDFKVKICTVTKPFVTYIFNELEDVKIKVENESTKKELRI